MTDERKNAAGREPAACCRLLSELQLERSLVRIVDDNAQTCDSLRFFLESLGFNADTWTDPVRFLSEWREDARPGCILLDIRMPELSGLELLEKLAAQKCPHPIVFLTGHGDVEMAVRALKRGASDFLLKPPEEEKIVNAVERAVLLGFERSSEARIGKDALERWSRLTDRERDVIELVAKGLMNKQIADLLNIADKTVQQHRGSACRKLSIRNAVEAAEFLRLLQKAEDDSWS